MTNPPRPQPRPVTTKRHGSVLLLVLIVVAALTLATQSYLKLMKNERLAVHYHGQQAQATRLAESGVEYVTAVLARSRAEQLELGGLVDNADLLRATPVDSSDEDAGRFTIFTLAPTDHGTAPLRYGLQDESSRLHLLACLAEKDDVAARNRLLGLPGMNEALADAILDWIDEDDFPREFGAEADYYQTLDPPVTPTNGLPASLDELLAVRDVTPAHLYGNDANRNGRLDDEEQASEQAIADPAAALGWAPFLTLTSVEHRAAADLDERANVNQQDLQALYQELSTPIGDAEAKFVVLYRQYGGSTDSESGNPSGSSSASRGREEQPSRDAGAENDRSTDAESIEIDYQTPGEVQIQSLLELVDATVTIPADEEQPESQPQQVASPWKSDNSTLREIAKLHDHAEVTPANPIAGRININLAPRPVLLSLPDATTGLVEQIILHRDPTAEAYRHPIWLWTEQVVPLETMKKLEPYITTLGSVYRVQVVGHFPDGGPTARIEVCIDRGGETPRLVSWRDWTILGPGLTPNELGQREEELE